MILEALNFLKNQFTLPTLANFIGKASTIEITVKI